MAPGSSTIDVSVAPRHIDIATDGISLPEAPQPDAISHAAFVRWLLGAMLVAIGAIGALNWYVDPTGVTGRETRWRIAENAEVRSEKLDLYEALLRAGDAPAVVLLGSSRTMKFDPADVQDVAGAAAFNASVSGGVPRDALLFVELLRERQGAAFPHLVWGLDVDAFRVKRLRDGLATDPRMSRFLTRSELLSLRLATAGTLTELQTLQATWRSLRHGGTPPAERAAQQQRRFSATGFQSWSLPFPRQDALLDRAVRRQVAQYASFVFERDAYTEVEDEPLDEFRAAVRIANRHGDVPTIFLTPYHPLAERLLAEHDLAAREHDVRTTLRRLQRDGDLRFEVVDLSDLSSFGGDPAQFYDGVHMTRANTRRVLERLERDRLLAPR